MPHRAPTFRASPPVPRVDRRPSAARRGYGAAWQRVRPVFLRANPLCFYCLILGRLTPAECIDHYQPISGPDDPGAMDEANWRSCCLACNTRKGTTPGPVYEANVRRQASA
jgi:5-methylcytosine-specific restriction protein A